MRRFSTARLRTAAAVLLTVAPAVAAAQAVTLTGQTLSGTADIYASGQSSVPAFGGGGGVLPTLVSFSATSGRVLTFANVTGSVTCDGGQATGPDGAAICGTGSTINSASNLSGYRTDVRNLALVGVFLGPTAPTTAPAALTFGAGGTDYSFATLSPLIGQVFYIGDGLTGTGSGLTQLFNVPTLATRLFLGFADAYAFNGDPGYYDDNTGTLTYSLAITAGGAATTTTPEPSTWVLVGAGLASVAVLRRRFAKG